METIENVLVVGDKNVVRDLFNTQAIGKNGMPRKRGILIPGGGMSGYVTGTRLGVFHSEGILADHFDAGAGTSSSTYNLCGYAARQTHFIASMYEALTWFNPRTFYDIWTGDFAGTMRLERSLREVLDVQTLINSHMELSIGVSNLKANPILHNIRKVDDIFDLIYASSALFPFVPGRVVKGVYCVDGGFARRSILISWLREWLGGMSEHDEVDLLFLSNRPHHDHQYRLEELIYKSIVDWALMPYPELRLGARSIALKLRMLGKIFKRQYPCIRMCALYPLPDENIHMMERFKHVLRRRGDLTRGRTERFLRALKPAREI